MSSLARAARDKPELVESADVFVSFVTVDDSGGDFARLVTRRTYTPTRSASHMRHPRTNIHLDAPDLAPEQWLLPPAGHRVRR